MVRNTASDDASHTVAPVRFFSFFFFVSLTILIPVCRSKNIPGCCALSYDFKWVLLVMGNEGQCCYCIR